MTDILLNRSAAHLWFIYALLGVYLFLPILTHFYAQSSATQKIIVIAAWFVGASLNQFMKRLTGHPLIAIDLSYLPLWGGYMMIGAIVYPWLQKHRGAGWLALSSVVFIGCIYEVATLTWDWIFTDHTPTTIFFDYPSPLVVVATVSSFVMLQLIFDRIRISALRLSVSAISTRTFGIYLSHFLLLQAYFLAAKGGFLFVEDVGAWAWFPLACVAALVSSTLLVWCLQQVPVIRILCPD
jgi:surface polysaccharide O-acyltransferase-like enzyme